MVGISRAVPALCIMAALSPPSALAVEFAPFAGHTYGGSFEDASNGDRYQVGDSRSYGVFVDIDDVPGKQLEFFVSRQPTRLSTVGLFTSIPRFDLSISYVHVGGLYLLPGYRVVHPFISGSIGLTSMEPQDASLSNENHPSLSVGAGVKYFATRNIGVRLELRGIYTMLESESAIFCAGGCTIKVRGSGFVQTSVIAAAIWRL